MTDPKPHWTHYVEPGSRHCLLCRDHECNLATPCARTELSKTLTEDEKELQTEHLGQMHCGRTQVDAYGTYLTVEFVIAGDDFETVIATSAERAYIWVERLYKWLDKNGHR